MHFHFCWLSIALTVNPHMHYMKQQLKHDSSVFIDFVQLIIFIPLVFMSDLCPDITILVDWA